MTNITIAIPDERLLKLKEKAAYFKVTSEDLVRVSIEEILALPDYAFQRSGIRIKKEC